MKTSEEWAERALAIVKTDVPKGTPLRVIIEETVRAAVAEAVEVVAVHLEQEADGWDAVASKWESLAASDAVPNVPKSSKMHHSDRFIAAALRDTAAAIRSRGG